MRALLLLVQLASPVLAGPKPLPARLSKAAGDAFGAAQKADAKGDLDEAVKQYRRAHAIAPDIASATFARTSWFDSARRASENPPWTAPNRASRVARIRTRW